MAKTVSNRTQTGIEGLDKALNGGIPSGNLVLLSGGAGTGKSTLCLQFLVNGALKYGEKGVYISTEQNYNEILKQASGFGWDLEALVKKNLLRIHYFDFTKANDFMADLHRTIADFSPQRLAIDSMTTLTDAMLVSGVSEQEAFSMVQIAETVSPIPRTEKVVAKSILYRLILGLKKYGVTTLLTSELYEEAKQLSADGVTEFIADGVVTMYYLGLAGADTRTMRVRKMRYSAHNKSYLPYEIKGLEGLVVHEEEAMDVLMK